jgi:hypothetical protein
VTGLEAIPFVGRVAVSLLTLFSTKYRDIERQRPEVLLRIRRRENQNTEWRSANFSVTNQPNQQLVATEIALGWRSRGVRIAPAIVEGNNKWRMDTTRTKGRTLKVSEILRGLKPRQNVPFFIRHPLDAIDGGHHSIKVWILIEHRTDASLRWWTGIEIQLPQRPGDDILFNRRGPHR